MKIRRWVSPAAAALGLTVLTPLPAQAGNPPYGALAWSKYKHVTAAGFATTKVGAIRAARDNCARKSGVLDCVTLNWFHNAVGALAESDNNRAGTGQGWGWKADGSPDLRRARREARAHAVKTCTAIGGTNCKVVYSVNAGVVAHGEGGPVPLPKPYPSPFPRKQQPKQPREPGTKMTAAKVLPVKEASTVCMTAIGNEARDWAIGYLLKDMHPGDEEVYKVVKGTWSGGNAIIEVKYRLKNGQYENALFSLGRVVSRGVGMFPDKQTRAFGALGTAGLYCLEAGFYLTGKAGEATGKTLRSELIQMLDSAGTPGVAAADQLAEAVKKDKGDLVISDKPVKAALAQALAALQPLFKPKP